MGSCHMEGLLKCLLLLLLLISIIAKSDVDYKSGRPYVLHSLEDQGILENCGLKEGTTEQVGPRDAA